MEWRERGRRCDAGITLLYWQASEVELARTDADRSFHGSLSVCAALYGTDPDDTEPLPPAANAPASADTGQVDDELLPENSPLVIAVVLTAGPPAPTGSEYSYTDSKLPTPAS